MGRVDGGYEDAPLQSLYDVTIASICNFSGRQYVNISVSVPVVAVNEILVEVHFVYNAHLPLSLAKTATQ